MGLSFRGEFDQKVDAKGRMSIPADFRRVLEAGDPDFPEKKSNPRLVLLYGPHLKDHLQVYTIDEMTEIESRIRELPRGSQKRKRASRFILGKSWETEVDRDGRIVLPKERREQIGLEGQAIMTAMGDHFEIWNTRTFKAQEVAETEEYLDQMPEGYDPMSMLEPDASELSNVG
ncbi:MAG: transcriptional regulator MraZ [Rhodobacterales bacterium]|nr:MAG: transcriptional regulator MraZ [Rhodobacterales bacterium]